MALRKPLILRKLRSSCLEGCMALTPAIVNFLTASALGETVCITRRGKPVAQLTAIDDRRKRIDPSALRAITDAMPTQPEGARDFVRRIRDGERY